MSGAIMHRMDWDDLRFFLAVARKGSIRAGAESLRVNHSTVSRRINAYEKKLGVRLFERLPTGYVLTAAGEDMVASVERIEEEVASLDRQVFGQDMQLNGNLRVTMPLPFCLRLLMPDVAKFSETYPGIELELAISYEEFNLTKREADIAIRVTNNPPEHLVGRKLIQYTTAVYASTAYLAKHDPVNNPATMNWIGWDAMFDHQWMKNSNYSDLAAHHQINETLAQLEAAKAGMGITQLPCFMGDKESELQRLPPGIPAPSWSVWILTHKDLRYTARVRAFIDFMVIAFDAHRDLLEGRCLNSP
jgi:DNA-binding transcriptional LysR family regulator